MIKGAPINEHRPPAPVSRQEPLSLTLKTNRSSHWLRSSKRQANCTLRTLHQHSRMASVQMRRKGTERSRLRQRHPKATPCLTADTFSLSSSWLATTKDFCLCIKRMGFITTKDQNIKTKSTQILTPIENDYNYYIYQLMHTIIYLLDSLLLYYQSFSGCEVDFYYFYSVKMQKNNWNVFLDQLQLCFHTSLAKTVFPQIKTRTRLQPGSVIKSRSNNDFHK